MFDTNPHTTYSLFEVLEVELLVCVDDSITLHLIYSTRVQMCVCLCVCGGYNYVYMAR